MPRPPLPEIRLRTKRLFLSPMKEAESIHLHWLNDHLHMRWSEQRHSKHDNISQSVYLANAGEWIGGVGYVVYGIRTADNTLVGTISAHIDLNNGIADLGLLIGPENAKLGYGTEAYRALSEHLLSKRDSIRKLEAGCVEGNVAMQRILNRCNFRLEGTRFNHFEIDGKPYDLLLFGRFR